MMMTTILGIILVGLASNGKIMVVPTEAFVIAPSSVSSSSSSSSPSSQSSSPTTATFAPARRTRPSVSTAFTPTELFGKKVKPGGLADVVSEEGSGSGSGSGPGRTGVKQRSRRTSGKDRSGGNKKAPTVGSKKATSTSAGISPALASWMATQDDGGADGGAAAAAVEEDATVVVGEVGVDEAGSSPLSYQRFEVQSSSSTSTTTSSSSSGGRSRRIKQGKRAELEAQRSAQIKEIVDRLDDVLREKSGNVGAILDVVQQLLDVPSSLASADGGGGTAGLRQLLTGRRRLDYRLAWAGSDGAVCHVGTALHKVALARLQEVFLSCVGQSRVEWVEVIRILGPFPNVKNTLRGDARVLPGNGGGEGGVARIQIAMDSMVDGTGKEILAGGEESIRRVDLQIQFSDERVIVAVIPPGDGTSTLFRSNPLEDDGANVLVFVREDDLDEKLDALRVS